MKILGIDVGGKRSAWAYADKFGEEGNSFMTGPFTNFESQMRTLVETWKPDLIYVGKPNVTGKRWNLNVTIAQCKLMGILCLVAEKKDIAVIEINDSSARAICYPGHGRDKKEDIQVLTGINDPDLNDATVFARAGLIQSTHK